MSANTFSYFENVGGLNLRYNDVLISDKEAEEITNLHATSQGSWSTQNIGYAKLNASALESGSSISGIYQYVAPNGVRHFVLAAGTKVFTFNPNTGVETQIGSGLAGDKPMQFTTFKGLLIACNGSDPPQKWTGEESVEALGGWPAVIVGVTPGNPGLCATFANRIVLAGDSENPSMLYISEFENPENYTPDVGSTSAGAIQVSPGDGEKITGIINLFLPITNEEVLVVFKERSTYLLTGSDADSFAIQKVSGEFGAVSHNSAVLVGNEILFLSQEGITSISTATLQGNITTGFISDRIRSQINTLNRNFLERSFAVHLRNRQEVWWFVADGSSPQNNLVLVLNYGQNNSWSKRSGIKALCGAQIDGLLYTGDYTGFVHQQLKGNTYDGNPINWVYRTPFYAFGAARRRKRVKDVEIYFKQISTVDITVKTAWDLKRGEPNRQSRLLSVNPDSGSSIYNISHYGTDTYNTQGSAILKMIPNGSGQYFQMEFSGNTVNKPIELEGWSISTFYGGYL